MPSGGFRFALPTLRSAMTKEKRKRNADRRVQPTSASRDAARTSGCARLSAFHHGSYRQGFRPLGAAPGQASWDAAGRSILYGRSNRGAKDLALLTRVLPAPACPSPGNAPPGPVVVPVSMMPEAARVRSVSFRARAPHSLRIREYPRPKASFTERDSKAAL